MDKPHVNYEKIDRAFDVLAVMDYVLKSLSCEELSEMREILRTVREKRVQDG